MRKIIAIMPAIVVLSSAVALAQTNIWQTRTDGYLTYWSAPSYNIVGISGGDALFYGADQTVKDFYFAGGTTIGNHYGTKLAITNLWVTPDTLGLGHRLAGINVSVENLILQVGTSTPYEGSPTFGKAETRSSVILAKDYIQDSNTTVGRVGWGVPNNFGVTIMGNGIIDNLTMSGGTVVNVGTINNLTYSGGVYVGDGKVGNLVFGDNGGILTITGFADGEDMKFIGINATNVDLTYANIMLDMTHLGSANDFYGTSMTRSLTFSDMFGGANIVSDSFWHLNSFSILWADTAEMYRVFANSTFASDEWRFTDGALVWTNGIDPTSTGTPEPATLLIFGLGLAGLGLARRQRKLKHMVSMGISVSNRF